MPSAEHWDDLAAARSRQEKAARPRGAFTYDTGISSVGRRFTAHLLDTLLAVVTLGVGWLVWSLLAWRRGQSPAKQLLGMYVVHDGRRASWGRMAVREILCKGVAGLICGLLARPSYGLSLIPYFFWLCFDSENQALWDRPAGTLVMEERGDD
jgi:uncharacterized RDD family membrane protein YckC